MLKRKYPRNRIREARTQPIEREPDPGVQEIQTKHLEGPAENKGRSAGSKRRQPKKDKPT